MKSNDQQRKEGIIEDSAVYQRIGMALISAQRVEFLTGKILEHLAEFNHYFTMITSEEFLANTAKALRARKTLGEVFKLLKLNPEWVIEDELNEYLKRRNLLVHGFWQTHLNTKSQQNSQAALDFCNEFGRMSDSIESFFKGLLYFLALRYVEDRNHLDEGFKLWDSDFEHFLVTLKAKKLVNTSTV